MTTRTNQPALTPTLIREAHGMTLREVAGQAGVSVTTLGQLERGESVTVKTLRKVAAVYDLTPDALLRAMEAVSGSAA